uniref:J domain-containing protein n=1 Tax=Chaetoceros debilis TaxID=122233 RepID=A0A7S3VET7_9STRA|mmetsp:Transcript_3725/g.5566  ORF Transcript_3725/g.5566 Transcript_3725/m.5566 type:complete len:296 (+) Transcript_3725:127-1014(+)
MNHHQSSQQDPYETLNVPRSASQSQIKSAYRKLALKYHPDRHQGAGISSEERQRFTEKFTNIGNAYEIIGDTRRREHFDRFGADAGTENARDHNHRSTAGSNVNRHQQRSDPFGGFGGFGGFGSFFGNGMAARDPFMNDPFFNRGMNTGRSSQGQGGNQDFTDPFEVFQQFFGDNFSHGFHNEDYMNHHHNSMHNQQQNNQQQQQQRSSHGNFGHGGSGSGSRFHTGGQTSFFSSSSTSFGGSTSESVSTTTRIINGRRQTVTERCRTNPDGTVERTTETTGDDKFQLRDRQGRR